jgi:hypothetical protein
MMGMPYAITDFKTFSFTTLPLTEKIKMPKNIAEKI